MCGNVSFTEKTTKDQVGEGTVLFNDFNKNRESLGETEKISSENQENQIHSERANGKYRKET